MVCGSGYQGEVPEEPIVKCEWRRPIKAGLLAAGIKEMCDDNTEGNNWDWHDFGATALGVLVVVVFIILLHFGKG